VAREVIEALVIDADVGERDRIAAFLTSKGCIVRSTGEPKEGLKLFVRHEPEIVFTEIVFAEMDGIELVRALQSDNVNAFIAVLTDRQDAQSVIACLDAGARAFLPKPVDPDQVSSTLLRFRGMIQRGRNKLLRPEDFNSVELSLELKTRKHALIPAVNAVLSLVDPYVKERELKRIELALHEIVRNSYEHGNLGLTFQEKRALLTDGLLEQKLDELANDPHLSNKIISVDAQIINGVFSCTVRDEGLGFDWRQATERAQKREALKPSELHGRGLILIRSVFDAVEFSEPGNEITITKRLY